MNAPVASIQWKGTAACFDVRCACGESTHVDTEMPHSGILRCGACKQLWELPLDLTLTAASENHWDAKHAPVTT